MNLQQKFISRADGLHAVPKPQRRARHATEGRRGGEVVAQIGEWNRGSDLGGMRRVRGGGGPDVAAFASGARTTSTIKHGPAERAPHPTMSVLPAQLDFNTLPDAATRLVMRQGIKQQEHNIDSVDDKISALESILANLIAETKAQVSALADEKKALEGRVASVKGYLAP
jgi:hypothetical protein